MMAHWMRVGFVHGVRTPTTCRSWASPTTTPLRLARGLRSQLDAEHDRCGGRRYRFGSQPQVAHWNLAQLARALAQVFPTVAPLQAGMDRYAEVYAEASRMMTAQKLGLATLEDDDSIWISSLFELMNDAQLDMTLFFRLLADVDLSIIGSPSIDVLRPAFYVDPLPAEHELRLIDWLKLYAAASPKMAPIRRNAARS